MGGSPRWGSTAAGRTEGPLTEPLQAMIMVSPSTAVAIGAVVCFNGPWLSKIRCSESRPEPRSLLHHARSEGDSQFELAGQFELGGRPFSQLEPGIQLGQSTCGQYECSQFKPGILLRNQFLQLACSRCSSRSRRFFSLLSKFGCACSSMAL